MDMRGIAPCGIDCANCELYAENGRREVWERAAARLGKRPEEMACKGCREQPGCVMHDGCETLACIKAKGHELCLECAEFPCRKLMPLAEGASFYPHNMKLWNLLRIRRLGPEGFIAEAAMSRAFYYKGKFKIGAGPPLEG